MPSPITKIRGFLRHLLGQRFERGLHERELRDRWPAAASLRIGMRPSPAAARRRRGPWPSPGRARGSPRRIAMASTTCASTSSSIGVELGLRRRSSVVEQPAPQPLDRAARLPLLDLLARAIGEIAHAFGVRPGAIGLALDQRRPAAAAGPRDRLAAPPRRRPGRRCRRPRRRAGRSTRPRPATLGIAGGVLRTAPRWRTGCSRRRTGPAASRCWPGSALRGTRRC